MRNYSFKLKMAAIVAMMVLASAAAFAFYVASLSDATMRERTMGIKQLTQSAHAMIGHYHGLYKAGKMSEADAKEAALAAARALKYGKGEYFWINDVGGVMLAQPADPKIEGQNRLGVKDAAGKLYYKEFVDVATANKEGGFVSYMRNKPGHDEPLPKMSYVMDFEPWGWVVGTGVYVDDVRDEVLHRAVVLGAGMGLCGVLVLLVVLLIVTDTVNSLKRTTKAISALAEGDLDATVGGPARKDEIGEIAAALDVFRKHAKERVALEAEGRAEQARRDAKQARMEELARAFNDGVRSVLGEVGKSARELHDAASSMTSVADETKRQTAIVAAASDQAYRNVEMVASTTTELAAAEQEIARQVTLASQTAGHAAHQAADVGTIVKNLSESAARISGVVGLISDIAAQTNLLALNATIEAARAGEAGKGFAVVANEVKHLASQTGRATDDITSQIAGIEAATKAAVEAITAIGSTVEDIRLNADAIASAVEEQSAATQEIARNVHEASAGTNGVSEGIASVKTGAETNDAEARRVFSTAETLTAKANLLAAEVSSFLEALKSID
jgi:methyl-accepting chemotaxis protein